MIDTQSVMLNSGVSDYLQNLWPKMSMTPLDPESFDYKNLLKIAEAEGMDTKRMHLKIRVEYALCGFETDGDMVKAVFRSEPLCWTDLPSDWWWTSQRHEEPFKDLLRKATDTRMPVRVNLPDLELLPVPKWYSSAIKWSLTKKS